MIKEELKRYDDKDPSRIFIGGTSQGGMIALATVLKYEGKKPLGGVVTTFSMIPLTPKNYKKGKSEVDVLS